jgi:hypothetical protein
MFANILKSTTIFEDVIGAFFLIFGAMPAAFFLMITILPPAPSACAEVTPDAPAPSHARIETPAQAPAL